MPKRIAKERADNGTAHNRKTARSRNEEISDAMIAFIQAHIAFVKALSEIAKTADLTYSQCFSLWTMLISDRPLKPGELSLYLPVEVNSITALLDRLESRALIKRNHSKTDRRNIELELTDAGKRLILKIVPKIVKVKYLSFGSLSSEELANISRSARNIRNGCVKYMGGNVTRSEATARYLVSIMEKRKDLVKFGGESLP